MIPAFEAVGAKIETAPEDNRLECWSRPNRPPYKFFLQREMIGDVEAAQADY